MSSDAVGTWLPVEKEQALLSVGSPSKAKVQYKAIREGFLEAEEVALTRKSDEVGT